MMIKHVSRHCHIFPDRYGTKLPPLETMSIVGKTWALELDRHMQILALARISCWTLCMSVISKLWHSHLSIRNNNLTL